MRPHAPAQRLSRPRAQSPTENLKVMNKPGLFDLGPSICCVPSRKLIAVNQRQSMIFGGTHFCPFRESTSGYEIPSKRTLLLNHALELLNTRAADGVIDTISFALDDNYSVGVKDVAVNSVVIRTGRKARRKAGTLKEAHNVTFKYDWVQLHQKRYDRLSVIGRFRTQGHGCIGAKCVEKCFLGATRPFKYDKRKHESRQWIADLAVLDERFEDCGDACCSEK